MNRFSYPAPDKHELLFIFSPIKWNWLISNHSPDGDLPARYCAAAQWLWKHWNKRPWCSFSRSIFEKEKTTTTCFFSFQAGRSERTSRAAKEKKNESNRKWQPQSNECPCYYYCFLLVLLFLSARWDDKPSPRLASEWCQPFHSISRKTQNTSTDAWGCVWVCERED